MICEVCGRRFSYRTPGYKKIGKGKERKYLCPKCAGHKRQARLGEKPKRKIGRKAETVKLGAFHASTPTELQNMQTKAYRETLIALKKLKPGTEQRFLGALRMRLEGRRMFATVYSLPRIRAVEAGISQAEREHRKRRKPKPRTRPKRPRLGGRGRTHTGMVVNLVLLEALKRGYVMNAIKDFEKKGSHARVKQTFLGGRKLTGIAKEQPLFTSLAKQGLKRADVESALRELIKEGDVYVPKPGYYKRT